MKRYTAGILTFIAIAALISGAVWHMGSWSGRKGQGSASVPKVDLIAVGAPHRRDFSVRCRWFGKTESKGAVTVVALESGRISSVEVEDEIAVKKGALLFTLGGPRIRIYAQAMQLRIASLQERLALAERAVAIKQEAVAEKMAKKVDLLSAKDALCNIRSALGEAKQELSSYRNRLQIRAPLDGVVTARRINVGQEVEKGDTLAEIIPQGFLRIVATLFPPEGASLKGLKAVVYAAGDKTVSATVTKALPQHTREGAAVVWLESDDVSRDFAPGETVSGDVILSIHKGTLAVPIDAVIHDEQERSFIFLKTPQGYRKQAVRMGQVSDGWVEIMEGVGESDKVVIRGAYELFYQNFTQIYKVED